MPGFPSNKAVVQVTSARFANRAEMKDDLLRLKISLLDTEVWREVLVPADFSLAKLHTVIQLCMGWQDYHLHDFSVGRSKLAAKTSLADAFAKVGSKILYTYDYGDSWEHEVKLVAREARSEAAQVPSCTDGALACPPEDCGGTPGYAELCELLELDDLDEEDQERVDWAEGWKPELFDRVACNRALAKRFKLKAAAPRAKAENSGVVPFTEKQGQYLAFIFWSTRVNRCPPAQADIQRFFGVTAPAVQQMITTLGKLGLLDRVPGQARAIQVTVAEDQLPRLEEPSTPLYSPGKTWMR